MVTALLVLIVMALLFPAFTRAFAAGAIMFVAIFFIFLWIGVSNDFSPDFVVGGTLLVWGAWLLTKMAGKFF
jgi:hypothetical protein